jgi:hypothetical protein
LKGQITLLNTINKIGLIYSEEAPDCLMDPGLNCLAAFPSLGIVTLMVTLRIKVQKI